MFSDSDDMNDREVMIEMITSTQVANSEVFNQVLEESPMTAKLMLDKFKSFLNNEYFTAMERQTVLIRFLEEQDNVDIVKEILTVVENSKFKSDYAPIVMEWTYKNSERIVQANLARVDGRMLGSRKRKPLPKVEFNINDNDFMNVLMDITKQILDRDDNNGDDLIG